MPFQIIIRIKVPSSMLNLPEQKRLELIDSWVEDQESLTIESAKLVRKAIIKYCIRKED